MKNREISEKTNTETNTGVKSVTNVMRLSQSLVA